MMNSKTMLHDFVRRLTLRDDPDEIQGIAYQVFEHLFHLSRTEMLMGKEIIPTAAEEDRLAEIVTRLNRHEPIQYVLGEAYFFGRKFAVSSAVLIPRPETEELVQAILHHSLPGEPDSLSILDIGTGSGCIATTLALELRPAKVYATDVSPAALQVATQNANTLQASVSFLPHNILTEPLPFTNLSAVVSNPPYITTREQAAMHANVLDYEPHLALFVPDDDPLLFYRAIAARAFPALVSKGLLAVEINEQYAAAVEEAFRAAGFSNMKTVRDIPGKDRIVMAVKP
ncbi:peptide chain release factor N(5)-glutamine methyltransferase [Fulvivirgaceae bacterium PWU5]|uniref:Release factor glutamine methyltransferase n=1 Tax=Dawidia cretensis TaxID=2782350 RepID=A0AAP2GQK1_9BACT|nr:peptide chain release factor N(5)-glutamine methyltransferase [Dawidia cretensis]MBT1709751.1 peptide chain release factor N(5)-glutamine methyltransferase [Dawidia cretensis]